MYILVLLSYFFIFLTLSLHWVFIVRDIELFELEVKMTGYGCFSKFSTVSCVYGCVGSIMGKHDKEIALVAAFDWEYWAQLLTVHLSG